jgi:hypothetical protein
MTWLLVLRILCAPLHEMPPKNRLLWRVWLKLMEARYNQAERLMGRDRARVYDYIPF